MTIMNLPILKWWISFKVQESVYLDDIYSAILMYLEILSILIEVFWIFVFIFLSLYIYYIGMAFKMIISKMIYVLYIFLEQQVLIFCEIAKNEYFYFILILSVESIHYLLILGSR